MRDRYVGLLLTLATAFVAISPTMFGQSVPPSGGTANKAIPRMPDGKPNLSGVWERLPMDTNNSDSFAFEEPSMTPWAEARYRAARQGIAEHDQGREDIDPTLYPYCMPPGIPRAYLRTGPLGIHHTPSLIFMHFESNNQARPIYLDGRKHPDGAPDMFMGHAIGRWDGDTLFVETTGLNGLLAWLDSLGHPLTDALRVEERIRRVTHNKLQIDFLFDDRKAYTKPWTGRKDWELRPNWEILEYTHCGDQIREDYLQKALGGDKGP